jgi:hypothetical protein
LVSELAGTSKRVFPPEAENAIADVIRENYIETGRSPMSRIIAELATNAYGALPPDHLHVEYLCASARRADASMERCRFALRIPHLEQGMQILVNA